MTTVHRPAAEEPAREQARPASGGLLASEAPLVEVHDVALLDLDGVVYRGPRPVDGAIEAVAAARKAGMRLAYVTNNASRTPAAVAAQLAGMGMAADPADVVTAAQAAARLVAERHGTGVRVLAVGGAGLREALTDVGCELVGSADDRPDVVVQGYAPDLTYADLAEAALAVGRGAWWVATNGDRTLPTERGVQPGNGALVGAVAAAVGHGPAVYAGKPDRALIAEAIRRTSAERPLVVGDRLDTDIEGAVRAGLPSLCVLTGVSTGADVVRAAPGCRPSYLGADLSALLQAHPAPSPAEGAWRCGGWTAVADGDAVEVTGDGDPVDLWRAVTAAGWAVADRGTSAGELRLGGAPMAAARAVGLAALSHTGPERAVG